MNRSILMVVLIASFAASTGASSSSRITLNPVSSQPPVDAAQQPGAQQPLAPGFQQAASLPTITITPGIPELVRVEYLGNGTIEAAHALILVPKAKSGIARTLALAQLTVTRTFAARPGLAEVDISIYQREGYAGFGGPSPLMTVSVPKARLQGFSSLKLNAVDEYDRLWINPVKSPLPPQVEASGETPVGVPEVAPSFVGSPQDQAKEKAEQQQAARSGSTRGGSYFQGDPNRAMAALTIDDAVHPLYAPLILDALHRTGGKATFFVVGRNVEAYPYFVRDLVKDGHEIANHTFHHVRLVGLSTAQIRDELESTNKLIRAISGEPVRFFRPPGGRYSKDVLRIASSLGMTTAFWTNDPADFNNVGAKVLEQRFLKYLRKGGIVLLHDNAQQTAPLLADFVNDAKGLGIKLVTLETLSGGK